MYATQQDIIDLHGADFLLLVAARGLERTLADAKTREAIADALAQASSEIDGYISTRYAVPVEPTPRIIQNHCINIAIYLMASTADRMTDIIRERYKDALAWLKDISTGKANLPPAQTGPGGQGGDTQAQAAPDLAVFENTESQFKRGSW